MSKLQKSNLLILEMVLNVIWNGASVDAKQLKDYCRPYTIECNAHARSNCIGAILVSSMKLFTEISCGNGNNRSAVPCTDDNNLSNIRRQ
jgi:hypothetical protein